MEDNIKIAKSKFNCEKIYNPNAKDITPSGYRFSKRRFRKEQEPEKIGYMITKKLAVEEKIKKEPVKFISRSFWNKIPEKFEKLELKKEKGIKKEEPKKEGISHTRNYYKKYSRENEQKKKQKHTKEEKPSEIAYIGQFKKAYIKLNDSQNYKREKSEQSLYRRFYKKWNEGNNDKNNLIKDYNQNKQKIFEYKGKHSKNLTIGEKNNNHKKGENVVIKKEIFNKKYNNHQGENIPTSINKTVLITSDIRTTTYASRRRIQHQKEVGQEETKIENKNDNICINNNKMKELYNYEDTFSIAITDQNKIEENLNKLKKSNNIEEYYNMLLYYYPILSPKICQKHQIEKVKTEKETLFDIINDLIEKFGDKIKNQNLKARDLSEYVGEILELPAKKELKKLKVKEIPSRWNYIYCQIVRFETETNEELIFYNLSNDLLNNIKNTDRAFHIIYFLKEFMKYYKKLNFNYNLPNTIKKFILLGLSNCEYIDKKYGNYLNSLNSIVNADNQKIREKIIDDLVNPNKYFNGNLHKVIIKYSKSKLSKSAFLKIFKLKEIPKELENEIFSNNISNYIYYLPFSSFNNTERTLRRFPLVLINTNKNKKFISLNNSVIDTLLDEFVNIVVI